VIYQDNVLLQLRGEGLADEAGRVSQQDGTVMYVVHPNCLVDDV